MEHLNLRWYLRNNRDVGRLNLVRLPSSPHTSIIVSVPQRQLLGVARDVERMHSLNIVHGNLKIVRTFLYSRFGPALTFIQTNILVDAGGRVHIAGLGVASIPSAVPGVGIDRSFYGAAPELINPQHFGLVDAESTQASDTYAFGIIAWEVSGDCVGSSGQNSKLNGAILRLLLDESHSTT